MEKTKAEELKEKLFNNKKVGWKNLNNEEKEKIFKFSDEYIYYLNNCKTEREAADFSKEILEKNGFKNIEECNELKNGDKVYYLNRGKSIYAAVIGQEDIAN